MFKLELRGRAKTASKLRPLRGRITIGEFQESLLASTHEWSSEDYLQQWQSAVRSWRDGADATAFVVDYMGGSEVVLIWWIAYRAGDIAIVHNALLLREYAPAFAPDKLPEFIPKYERLSDDGAPVSEWRVPARAIGRAQLSLV